MNKDRERDKLFKELTARKASDIEMAWNGFVRLYDQPDRLNPEERNLMEDLGIIQIEKSSISMDYFTLCDSRTPENKENQGDVEKFASAKCAKCDFPPNDGKRRIYCMCGQ